MQEILHKLEGLVRLLPEKAALEETSLSDIQGLLEEALREKEKVRMAFLDSALTLTEDKALRVLVRCYQDGLIRLSDIVYKGRQDYLPGHAHLYDPLLFGLDHLLLFLKEDFGDFINPDIKIPDAERERVQLLLREHWARISNALPLPADKLLIEQLDRWFFVLLDPAATPLLSERQSTYHRVLMNEFLDRMPEEEGTFQDYPLFTPMGESLVYMNFNHPAIPRQIIRGWSIGLKTLDGQGERAKRIQHWQTLLSKLPVQKAYALYPEKRTLRDQLEQWLGVRLECVHYRMDSPLQSGNRTPQSGYGNPPPYPDEPLPIGIIDEAYANYNRSVIASVKIAKLQLKVSVPDLGLFIRLLVDRKIITGLSQKEIVQFFATHFSTIQQQNVSAGSMLSSFYKPSHPSILFIRRCLKDWDMTLGKWE